MKTLRLPGGISVSFSGLGDEAAYHRAMDLLGVAMTPFKMISDLLNLILIVKRALESAIDIPTDPTEFIARFKDVTSLATKLASYIPQLAFPIMIRDCLVLLNELINSVRTKILQIQMIIAKRESVDLKVSLDPNLEVISIQIGVQQAGAMTELEEMLQPITLMTSIITSLSEIIGMKIPIPAVSMSDNLEDVDQQLQELQDYLTGFIAYMGG
jgi:hypothetical protein